MRKKAFKPDGTRCELFFATLNQFPGAVDDRLQRMLWNAGVQGAKNIVWNAVYQVSGADPAAASVVFDYG